MSKSNIQVIKRDGTKEDFNPEKIHKVIEWAIDGYDGVSVSEIEINAELKFTNGITTEEVHNALIDSSRDLIKLDSPNYQYVAARLLTYKLRKDVWGGPEAPNFLEFVSNLVSSGHYDPSILESYTEEEFDTIEGKIDHDRDDLFTFAGLQQMCDKYLVQDRTTKKLYETPQFAFMLVAMTLFANYSKKKRMKYAFKAYDYISKFKISLPTPIISGVRTPLKRYASCCLIDVDDTLESLAASNTAVLQYTASRSGIGLNMGRIRGINSPIRNGEVSHTGVVPFLKWFESTVKSCHQNGVRGGSLNSNTPVWHQEIEDIITLKNNTKTGDNSVRGLDYTIGFSELFYKRFLESMKTGKDVMITLFSPHDVPGLYDAFGHNDKFDPLYIKYENDPTIPKKQISAKELMSLYTKERRETARIYAFNADHVNSHSAWLDTVHMSNLCVEITQPTIPIKSVDDPNGEIGVCILAALNVLNLKSDLEIKTACDLSVRMLDELIDHQTYPIKAAENFTTKRRSLGIGVTNLAALFAKNNLRYDDPDSSDAPNFVDELFEKIQYNLIDTSVELAKEKGACEKFDRTTYSKGILPIDTYNKNVDSVVTRKPSKDWDALREKVLSHGMRNSTLTAIMPCESSSVVSNSTNGIEPIKQYLIFKSSKVGNLPFIVPNYSKWKNRYTLQFDMKNNKGYSNITGAIQKWIDMAISCMHYYNYEHYEENKLPDSKLIQEMLYHYKMGNKTLYYTYSNDMDKQSINSKEEAGCEGGSCAI